MSPAWQTRHAYTTASIFRHLFPSMKLHRRLHENLLPRDAVVQRVVCRHRQPLSYFEKATAVPGRSIISPSLLATTIHCSNHTILVVPSPAGSSFTSPKRRLSSCPRHSLPDSTYVDVGEVPVAGVDKLQKRSFVKPAGSGDRRMSAVYNATTKRFQDIMSCVYFPADQARGCFFPSA